MNPKRVLTVVGARPQFIKAAPLSSALARVGLAEILVHTGQHYDRGMSDVFFEELDIPGPAIHLGIGQASRAVQLARMIEGLSDAIGREKPDAVVVYGDTTSTLAGALSARIAGTKLAHVEAGLRSFNRAMPEEFHRKLTDHAADLFFCPTPTAVELLRREGISDGVHLVGDTMYDAILRARDKAKSRAKLLADIGVAPGGYALATLHRPYNVDEPARLASLLGALGRIEMPVVFPIHPRTKACLAEGRLPANLRAIDPVGYLDMVALEADARLILTDSGGVQKEAYFLSIPCVTVRPETEWVETLDGGWNVLADEPDAIVAAARRPRPAQAPKPIFGDGNAAAAIAKILASEIRA
ncbi:MAG: UDP-N-acetylglucosamine 2-epimerase (non-hydrolyzing) [Proteobacteria bacterium]|nr:UDP-N-acetylglucosamine 2-epimerase (non-hydrolyzing) [Pseudomonadota bacterium]